MSGKIQLTPAELKAQATEMSSLQSEYEALFSGINSTLNSTSNNWSGTISGNFSGKIISARNGFSYITSALGNGAQAANSCAISYETIDGALAKICSGDADFSNAMGVSSNLGVALGTTSFGSGFNGDIKSVQDLYDYIDNLKKTAKGKDKLTIDALEIVAKTWFKKATKGTSLEGIDKAQKITKKILQGDYIGAADDFVSELYKTFDTKIIDKGLTWGTTLKGGINWTGLKVQAVTKTIKLVTDPKGYIQANDQKYMDMAESYLRKGDVPGLLTSMGGNFVQTVGKGSVDVTCQLTSGLIDSVTSKAFGVSLSDANKLMYDAVGWSPGHIFNSTTKAISNGVDVVVDGGIKIASGAGKAAVKGVKVVGSFIGGLFK